LGRLRYFYDHLSDFLQPDFRFGIFLSLIATISWAFGSLYTKKKSGHLQSLFQSWITNGNIEQLPFHWSDWHRCQHHQHSGNIMVGDCLLVIIGSVLSFIAFIYMIQNFRRKCSIYAYINL
jgi:drug/metabolite transporter (DMT)-like permease